MPTPNSFTRPPARRRPLGGGGVRCDARVGSLALKEGNEINFDGEDDDIFEEDAADMNASEVQERAK